jgi:2',3'-cyclic-nucleotide 2'-phosphodiesterase (5'-nucleotidase family)
VDTGGAFGQCRVVRLDGKRAALVACLLFAAVACKRARKDGSAKIPPPVWTTHGARPASTTPAPRGKHVALLYTSNDDSDYEQCGCPVHPLGGIARRATVIDRARAEADAVLVLDAGDLFLPQRGNFAAGWRPDAGEVERRGRLLAGAYGRIGTTALLPGERDLALGLPLLRRLAKQAGVPLLASNLYGGDGKRLFTADKIVDAAGTKIGVFGVTAPPTPDDAAAFKAAGIDARDPVAAARDEVAGLRERGARIVVALVHVGDGNANRKLLVAVPGIDWAVLGHSGMNLEMPEKAGSARMLEAMMKGKNVGRLDLHVVDDSLAFVDRGERVQIETILADHRKQLTDYDKRLGETDPATMRDYYEQRRKEIEAAIARETALLQTMPAAINGSWFENRIVPLDAATPDQPGVAILVDAYNKDSEKRAAAGKPVGLGTDPPGPKPATGADAAPRPAAGNYTGTAACGGCHAPALAFWKQTKHARALSALARVGRDKDPSCVGCHVTGYLQPSGYKIAERRGDAASPRRGAGARGDAEAPCGAGEKCDAHGAGRSPLENVGCESCHGPGSKHGAALDKRGTLARAVPEATCRGCHTADVTNGEFDYKKFIQAVVGPGHGLAPGAARPL